MGQKMEGRWNAVGRRVVGGRHEPTYASAIPLPQVWYFTANAACVFLLPFVNLFYRELGFAPSAIGLLAAAKPWISVRLRYCACCGLRALAVELTADCRLYSPCGLLYQ